MLKHLVERWILSITTCLNSCLMLYLSVVHHFIFICRVFNVLLVLLYQSGSRFYTCWHRQVRLGLCCVAVLIHARIIISVIVANHWCSKLATTLVLQLLLLLIVEHLDWDLQRLFWLRMLVFIWHWVTQRIAYRVRLLLHIFIFITVVSKEIAWHLQKLLCNTLRALVLQNWIHLVGVS